VFGSTTSATSPKPEVSGSNGTTPNGPTRPSAIAARVSSARYNLNSWLDIEGALQTVYGWIESGGIGEVGGLFVVQGRYLIHWPTFRTRQFKPRVKLRGQLPKYSEESQNGMAGNGQARPPDNRL
jgi:hypothetical protein